MRRLKWIWIIYILANTNSAYGQDSSKDLLMVKGKSGGTDLIIVNNSDTIKIAEYPANWILVDNIFTSSDSISVIIQAYDDYLFHKLKMIEGQWRVVVASAWAESSLNEYKIDGKYCSPQYKLINCDTVGRLEEDQLIPLKITYVKR